MSWNVVFVVNPFKFFQSKCYVWYDTIVLVLYFISVWFVVVIDDTKEVKVFMDHICAVMINCTFNHNIRFTCEVVRDKYLVFLDCAVHIEADKSLNSEVHKNNRSHGLVSSFRLPSSSMT